MIRTVVQPMLTGFLFGRCLGLYLLTKPVGLVEVIVAGLVVASTFPLWRDK